MIAQPRLPADVRNIGVTVAKASPDLMMVVHLLSPDNSRDTLFIPNYANVNVVDTLSRLNGIGSITVFGGRDTTHGKINADLGKPDDPATKALFDFVADALKK